jgi:cobalamin biosynthesis Mg chelatase CobN
MLLAMAAAQGSVVALLLVASMTSTRTRPARRKQLRTISAGTQRQAAAPAREQTSLLDEWLGRHVPPGDLGQPVR